MVRIKIIISLLILLLCSISYAEETDEYVKLVEKYKAQYNFFSMEDTLYTIKSEYEIPEGYSYIEYNDSIGYPSWVANFPIWHKYKSVGNWKGMKFIEYDQVSRVIHLPWQGPLFKDFAVPVRILGEYYFQFNNRYALEVFPKAGERLSYKRWLEAKPAFNHRGEVLFKDDIQKDDSEEEYYRFLLFCMQNMSFESIIKNCDTVSIDDVQSGDMMIGYDEDGNDGKLLILLQIIANKSGDTKYIVANGCPEACDVHIPIINEDRDNPWVTHRQLIDYTKDYSNTKIYRFKAINSNKK